MLEGSKFKPQNLKYIDNDSILKVYENTLLWKSSIAYKKLGSGL